MNHLQIPVRRDLHRGKIFLTFLKLLFYVPGSGIINSLINFFKCHCRDPGQTSKYDAAGNAGITKKEARQRNTGTEEESKRVQENNNTPNRQ